jgi:hypothetical protein
MEKIIQIVEETNSSIQELGFKTEDPRTGLQLPEYWLPEPIKELLIEESNRPDKKKLHIALVKYFNPYGDATWYFSEYDPEANEFFGYCDLGIPDMSELGYVSNKELRETRAPPFNMPLERDLWFKPKRLEECR